MKKSSIMKTFFVGKNHGETIIITLDKTCIHQTCPGPSAKSGVPNLYFKKSAKLHNIVFFIDLIYQPQIAYFFIECYTEDPERDKILGLSKRTFKTMNYFIIFSLALWFFTIRLIWAWTQCYTYCMDILSRVSSVGPVTEHAQLSV